MLKKNKIIFLIFTVFFLIYPLLIILFNNFLLSIIVFTILTAVSFLLFKSKPIKINPRLVSYAPYIVFALALLSRLIIVFFMNDKIIQISDFSKAFSRANDLNFSGDMYYQIFSHWILYPNIIHNIFEVWGNSQLMALIFNALCVSLSSVLIYQITYKIFKNYKIGLIGSLIYILWPSTSFYVLIFSPDHIAGLLLLISVYLYLIFNNSWTEKKCFYNVLIAFIIGIIIGISTFFKNFGPVLLIAIIIICLLEMIINKKNILTIKKLGFVIIILISYIFSKNVTFNYIENLVGAKVGRNITPIYLNVGLNSKSKGYYNNEVYSMYFNELRQNNLNFGKTNNEIMKLLMFDIKSNYRGIPRMLYNKTITNFSTDNAKFNWVKNSVIDSQTDRVVFVIEKILKPLTNFHYVIIIFCMTFMVVQNYREKNLEILLLSLIIFGAAAMLMLVEAQGRYRYAIEPFMCILAGAGIYYYKNFVGGILNEKIYKVNKTKTLS
ncbi:MAG: glycosyltransferase family 39 protein [Bacilli bacterium]